MRERPHSLLDFIRDYCSPAMFLQDHQVAILSQLGAHKIVIPMVLHCPYCGTQHIDEPDLNTCQDCGLGRIDHTTLGMGCRSFNPWTNPPHRKHLCKPSDGGCGKNFQPAEINTNGVKKL